MNLQEIVNLAYKRLDDEKGVDSKKLWQNWELVSYANQAERDIAGRLELLKDSDTIGYLVLSGTAGQINSVSVSGVVITSAAVPFAASEAATAANLAANITSYTSTPDYRAVARGTVVIIKAVPHTGYPASGYSLAASVAGGGSVAVTNLTGLCRHVLAIGQRHIALHEKIIKITRFKPYAQTRPLSLYSKDAMDASYPGWEGEINGTVKNCVPDYENNEAIVYPPSKSVELIEQDVIRLPLVDLTISNPTAFPEIKAEHHETMIEKMMSLAYMKRDVEIQDPIRSSAHNTAYLTLVEQWRRENIKRSTVDSINRPHMGLM